MYHTQMYVCSVAELQDFVTIFPIACSGPLHSKDIAKRGTGKRKGERPSVYLAELNFFPTTSKNKVIKYCFI